MFLVLAIVGVVGVAGWSPMLAPWIAAAFGGVMVIGLVQLAEVRTRLSHHRRRFYEDNAVTAALVEATGDPACTLDGDLRITSFNRSFGLFYWQQMGREARAGLVFAEGSTATQKARWQALCGRALAVGRVTEESQAGAGTTWLLTSICRASVGNQSVGLVLVVKDITARRELEARVSAEVADERTAEKQDSLTGLPNWRGLIEHGQELLRIAREANRPFTVLCAELDRFDDHSDDTVCSVSAFLQRMLRHGDVVARVADDRFICLSVGVTPETLIQRIEHALASRHTPLSLTVEGVVAAQGEDFAQVVDRASAVASLVEQSRLRLVPLVPMGSN